MKNLVTIIFILLSISVLSVETKAQSVDLGEYVPNNTIIIDGLEYLLDDETMTADLFDRHKELSGHVVVPQYVTKKNKRYKVTIISNSVFLQQLNLTSIELPEELDKLGDGLFMTCKNLETVRMPTTLNNLVEACFDGCNNLKEIILPEGIEVIETNTFSDCYKLTKLIIPKSVKKIRRFVGSACSSLKEVILLNPNTIIDKAAFNPIVKIENWNGNISRERTEIVEVAGGTYIYVQRED